MMKPCLLFGAVMLALAISSTEAKQLSQELLLPGEKPFDDETAWQMFKVENKRVYKGEEEEAKRKEIFLDNLKEVRDNNDKYIKGEISYTLGAGPFADWTSKEFRKRSGPRPSPLYA